MSDPFIIRPQSPVVDKKRWGRTDLPDGKPASIAELEHDEVTKLIELAGTRVAWSRMTFCPCTAINAETDQPDPTCTKCKGRGYFHFGPRNYAVPSWIGDLTPLQQAILTTDGAALIRGLFQRAEQVQNPYDKLGNWVRGDPYISVRWENMLGYYDRLVLLDADHAYSEVVTLTGAITVPLRYRASQVNLIESVTTRYVPDVDFEVTDAGQVRWIITPPTGQVSVHYCAPPTYLVTEHPHAIRNTPRRSKKPAPQGVPQPQAVQARLGLEFRPKFNED